jgi:hypothetical protein
MSEMTLEDRALLDKMLKNPLQIPEEFKGWLQQYASTYALPEIEELAGFRTRRFQVATSIPTFEFLDNTPLSPHNLAVDLATVGPILTGLENGKYAVFAGMYSKDGTGNSRFFRFVYDGVGGVFPPSAVIEGQSTGFDLHTFTTNLTTGHEIRLKYGIATDNRTAYFGLRWLAAVRVS